MIKSDHEIKAAEEAAATGAQAGIAFEEYNDFAVQLTYTDTTPSADNALADSEVNFAGNQFTFTAHGMKVGLKGQLTSTATLPTGLSLATDYFIIVVDVNTVQFASSLSNAQAGTAVTFSDAGTAASTHTFTPTALASTVIKMQESVDGVNWSDLSGVATSGFTASGTTLLQGSSKCNNVRPYATFTAGQISTQATYFKKSN